MARTFMHRANHPSHPNWEADDVAFLCLLATSIYFAQGLTPAAVIAVFGLFGLIGVYSIQAILEGNT
jgi:hypothetical protein